MSDTIVFHGGVQVASIDGRDWVPKEDYDALFLDIDLRGAKYLIVMGGDPCRQIGVIEGDSLTRLLKLARAA